MRPKNHRQDIFWQALAFLKYFLLLSVVLVGCQPIYKSSPSGPPPPTTEFGGPSPIPGNGHPGFIIRTDPILITGRSFLEGNAKEQAGFGLYSYLLFGSNADNNRSQRLAAAKAYMGNLGTVEEILESHPEISPSQINVFFAFLRNNPPPQPDNLDDQAQWLVQNYNYTRARIILNRLGFEGDGVYLLSYFSPLGSAQSVNHEKLLDQNLSLVQAGMIETWVLEFRKQVRTENYWDELNLRQALLRIRTALPLIADKVKIIGSIMKGWWQ